MTKTTPADVFASEVAAWKARAETAEADAADTHRQCYDCRKDRRLEPTRIAAAVADERRKAIAKVESLSAALLEACDIGDRLASLECDSASEGRLLELRDLANKENPNE